MPYSRQNIFNCQLSIENGQLIEAKDERGREWEVAIIRAGRSGNGAYYPPEVLRAAVPLFEGVRALARSDDEHLRDVNKSVKDIVGWFSQPRFEEGRIISRFHISESADWLRRLLLDAWQQGKKDIVGFSIVAEGKARRKKVGQVLVTYVDSIEKVFTVDVVLNPAAGGKFLKLIAGQDQQQEAKRMERLLKLLERKAPDLFAKINPETVTEEQLLELLGKVLEQYSGGLLAEARETIKWAECRASLREKLAESRLPALAVQRLEKRFSDKIFQPGELESAIAEERQYLASLSESGRVVGLGQSRLDVGLEAGDRLQYAMDRLFGLEVPAEAQGIPRLAGLREAYVRLSGDVEISGRFNPQQRVTLREAFDSTTFSYILANTMQRRMVRDYNAVDYHERDIIAVRSGVSNFKQQEAIREGYFGDIADVDPETADYAEIASYSDEEATYSVGQKGNLVTITRKHILNDDLGRVVKKVSRLGRAARRTFARFVWNMVINNVTYTVDGLTLFHASHGNLGSAALDVTSLHAAAEALSFMTEPGSGEALGWPSEQFKLFIPGQLRSTAIQTVDAEKLPGGSQNDPNPVHKIAEIKIMPLFTDANDWVLACPTTDRDIIEVAFLNGNEEPELFVADSPTVGDMFKGDKLQYKIRHEYGGTPVDYRGIYKAVVA